MSAETESQINEKDHAFGFDNIQEVRYENLKALLSKSSRYSSLLLTKLQVDERKESKQAKRTGRKRKSENEESRNKKKQRSRKLDEKVLKDITKEDMTRSAANENADEDDHTHLCQYETPKSFHGSLRPYQVHGMNWLLKLYMNGMNGILADEMGLGKTIQIIAHFCNLLENGVQGPFLVIAPMSTLKNWVNEVKRFAPDILLPMLYHGAKNLRNALKSDVINCELSKAVVVTSYDMAMIERPFLCQFQWNYLVVDEGHRLKNMNCKLLKEMKFYSCQNKVLLTGTPLQNNLNELWSLLHFLMPSIFADLESFHLWLDQNSLIKEQTYSSKEGSNENGESDVAKKIASAEEREENVLSMVHQILTPFLLRRIKSEVELDLPDKQELLVYCPMADMQLHYYKIVSEKTILSILGQRNHEVDRMDYDKLWEDYGKNRRFTAEREMANVMKGDETKLTVSRQSAFHVLDDGDEMQRIFKKCKLTNFMVLLKRVCNHPFLLINPHPDGDMNWYEDYVTSCGKMELLDKMLVKLKDRGHKVLVFSQWTSILDIIEDSLSRRQYKYARIDGSTRLDSRQSQIDEFNREESEMFLFLLTTRAGGQGINLTAADTVIIYDSDWNPQMDLQAQDRCHRIGQTKPVVVYRLVSENTIDQKIVVRANAKRKLEKVVLKKGRFNASQKALTKHVLDVDEIKEILQKQEEQKVECREVTEEMIEQLLNRDKIFQMGLDDYLVEDNCSSSRPSSAANSSSGGDSGFFELVKSELDEDE